mgnify:CR=1 FL=1
MIKALLLDDEPLALRQLELYCGKVNDLQVLGACTSASAAFDLAEEADVLFVDINMPDVNGLDFVRSLVHPPLVVFTTAYSEYAVEGFRVQAVDYLLKPFGLEEFRRAMDRVRHILKVEQAAKEQSRPGILHFKTDYKTVTVPLRSIRYIESMSEYVKIWLDTQDTPLVVLYSLKKLMEELPGDRFMRIHRSYIVALSRIREASAAAVILEDGITLPVSESYRPAFRSWLASR